MNSSEAFSQIMTDDFVKFCRNMWTECLLERKRHGEEAILWVDYFEENHDYLVEKYWSQE